ncbi:MAG: right-handed parallel beta-helix repeat-containing protein, partial [Thermoplasmata archaeon]|nr:right-handed parallel beta-helix repeat-containing protein [Thermoplasmata archaeon]
MACALLATGALAVDPPASGDWVIDDVTTASGTDIVVTGNVTVARGGSLSLSDLSLLINVSEDGEYNIDVQPGGTLTMTGVTVDSLDRTTPFNLTISGSATLGQCTIRRMDGPVTPNPLAEPQGLVVLSSSVLIHNTTIELCGGFAVTVQPGGFVDVTPVIQDCNFLGNGGGLYCGGLLVAGGNARVVDCTFFANSVGDVVVVAADPIISHCSFMGAIVSPTIAGITAIGFAEPTIVGCDFSFTLSAINSILASPTVRNCNIAQSYIGVNVLGNAPVFDSVSISTTINPMILNATFAEVTDCTITSFLTPGYAVAIDSGGPVISRLSVDLTLMGGAISIINGSRTTISDSVLSGSGAAQVVYVEDAEPILDGCTIVGGTHGVELLWSRATLRGCAIQENSEWGIVSWFDTFTMNDVTFGSGGEVNSEGRVLQFYSLTVHVDLADGSPAIDATVLVYDA